MKPSIGCHPAYGRHIYLLCLGAFKAWLAEIIHMAWNSCLKESREGGKVICQSGNAVCGEGRLLIRRIPEKRSGSMTPEAKSGDVCTLYGV